jgi:pimeloyl-ACP methyl ester carboxylesterase
MRPTVEPKLARWWALCLCCLACTPAPPSRAPAHGEAKGSRELSASSSESLERAALGDAPVEPGSPPSPPPAEAAARATRSSLLELPVEGFEPALVALPDTSKRPLPLLIASHGAGGRPEYQCEFWPPLLEHRAIVLCPRGRPISRREDQGFYYPNHVELGKEVLAALAALQKRWPDAAHPESTVYAGYSQGATMGALMLLEHPEVARRAILIEGGHEAFGQASARRFGARGGERVLFVCGVSSCAQKAAAATRFLSQAGVLARHEHALGGGHTYYGLVGERIANTLAWALEGKAGWEP